MEMRLVEMGRSATSKLLFIGSSGAGQRFDDVLTPIRQDLPTIDEAADSTECRFTYARPGDSPGPADFRDSLLG